MKSGNVASSDDSLEADLHFLGVLRSGRKHFAERLCQESKSPSESVLAILRSEATYDFCEFFYQLRARGLQSEEALHKLAELHNQYIVELTKDPAKMMRLGLKMDRLFDAMFTADTMPRLLQHWQARPCAIEQSNLARFLVAVMSAETCRKLVITCNKAGFLERDRTSSGSIVVSSTGVIERIFGDHIREMRLLIQGGR